jgi:hypothetical protein
MKSVKNTVKKEDIKSVEERKTIKYPQVLIKEVQNSVRLPDTKIILEKGDKIKILLKEYDYEEIAEELEVYDYVTLMEDEKNFYAKIIANAWHDGMGSALYALASSGAIKNTYSILKEIDDITEPAVVDFMYQFVQEFGPRGPYPGWDQYNW